MKVECCDEGTIQAFLDGELDNAHVERFSLHISACDDCAVAVADAEQELAAAFAVLDREFDTLVPTRRLWTRINQSIAAEGRGRSLYETIFASLTNWTAAAIAGLLIVAGVFLGSYALRTNDAPRAQNEIQNGVGGNAAASGADNAVDISLADAPEIRPDELGTVEAEESNDDRTVAAGRRRNVRTPVRTFDPASKTDVPAAAATSDPLAGEATFIRTIETLEKSVDQRKDAAMGPSARFAYERDIAVASSVIEKLKDEVLRDPSNQTARELLRTTYQNKISLLNSVAEKTELMAILN